MTRVKYKKFTIAFAAIGVGLSILHFADMDPKNLLLFSFSIPLWFIPIFRDIRDVNLYFVYLLTIVSWIALGFLLDWLIARNLTNK